MCMNCGCGDVDARHHPTDITREDLQRAADGSGIAIAEAAQNVHDSTESMTAGRSDAGYAAAGSQHREQNQN